MQLPRLPSPQHGRWVLGGLHSWGSLGTGPGSIQDQGWRRDQRPAPAKVRLSWEDREEGKKEEFEWTVPWRLGIQHHHLHC